MTLHNEVGPIQPVEAVTEQMGVPGGLRQLPSLSQDAPPPPSLACGLPADPGSAASQLGADSSLSLSDIHSDLWKWELKP